MTGDREFAEAAAAIARLGDVPAIVARIDERTSTLAATVAEMKVATREHRLEIREEIVKMDGRFAAMESRLDVIAAEHRDAKVGARVILAVVGGAAAVIGWVSKTLAH